MFPSRRSLFQTWTLESTTGEPATLTFEAFDMDDCFEWVEVNDGTSTQRYCGPSSVNCDHCDYYGSTPGPVTGTNITVKLHTDIMITASGFLAVITGDVTVTTDVTGESGVAKCLFKLSNR